MKKVAIMTYDLNWIFAGGAKSGGASVVNKNLIIELSKMPDILLTIFCLNSDDVKAPSHVDVVKVPYGNSFTEFINNMETEISKRNFDIVLTLSLEYMNKNPFLQSQSFRKRCEIEPFPINLIKTFFGKKKIKRQDELFKNLDENNKYFAVSNSVKEDYVKNYNLNTENVYVCHLATEQIYEELPEITQKENITFGCVANNSVNKGGIYLLMALAISNLLGNKNFNVKLVSQKFQKSPFIKLLITILGLKNKIEIVEQSEGLKDFYTSIDCLILPSKNEAFGLVVIEAMAYGKPCIVSSTAGVSEIIEHKNGFVFNRNSFVDFIETINYVSNIYHKNFDKFKKVSNKAFQTSKIYTWQAFAQNILNKF